MECIGLKRQSTKFVLLAMVAVLSIGASCEPSESREYDRQQLIGVWHGLTLEGEAELIFAYEGGYYTYVLKAMPGSFPDRTIGEAFLSQGIWGLNKSIITLYDDQVQAYYTCVVSDRFDINLNVEGTIMTMTHFGTECVDRGQVMENATWYKQIEGE